MTQPCNFCYTCNITKIARLSHLRISLYKNYEIVSNTNVVYFSIYRVNTVHYVIKRQMSNLSFRSIINISKHRFRSCYFYFVNLADNGLFGMVDSDEEVPVFADCIDRAMFDAKCEDVRNLYVKNNRPPQDMCNNKYVKAFCCETCK